MIALFCYCMVRSGIPNINAEIQFMNDFMSQQDEQTEVGFYLTTLQGAKSALLDGTLPGDGRVL